MRHLVLLLVLFALAGCDLLGEDRPPRTDGRAVVASGTPEGLAEARQRWAEAGVARYRFEYARACECLPGASGPFVATVRGERVEDVESLAGEPLPDGYAAFTVERLFEAIEDAFEAGAASMGVTYDAALGFPVDVAIDYDEEVADEELIVRVEGFERLDR